MLASFKSRLLKAVAVPAAAALMWGFSLQDAAASPSSIQYVVKPGDNLWAIACKHQTTVDTIISANGLDSILIFPGQTLSIPVSSADTTDSSPAGNQTDTEYIVKKGDTLWAIAAEYGVKVGDLKSVNNLTSDALFVGQKLVLPSPRQDAFSVSRSGDRAQMLLDYARKHLGTPYRSGGSAPGGFDCSGFTSHVFGHFGISIPRTSYDQFKAGTAVSKSELRPGDLVFFSTYAAGASHVGIYVGNGQFIHSSSPRSGGVIYSSIGDSYYGPRYLGARRILP